MAGEIFFFFFTNSSTLGHYQRSGIRFLGAVRYNLPANNGRSSNVTALNNDVIDSNTIHSAEGIMETYDEMDCLPRARQPAF